MKSKTTGAPQAAAPAPNLPVTAVVLYSSGVSYFERKGTVKDDAVVDLKFKSGDINDLLKSLVVQDLGGGRIGTVVYASNEPADKTLRSFAVDLTGNPTLGGLLNQIRGEKIEAACPQPLIGTIVGVEKQTQRLTQDTTVETDILNLHTDAGLRSIPMSQIQHLKLLNPVLDAELTQALGVLAASHDTRKKAVGLVFTGKGERPVRLGYVVESPIWKTSYRLLVSEKDKPYLQGWAVVENMSDEDWKGVRLTLVSGRPISFIQDLYQPLYVSRPVVQAELYQSLRPPTYADAMERAADEDAGEEMAAEKDSSRGRAKMARRGPAPAPPASMAVGGLASFGAGGKADMESFRETAAPAATGGQIGELFQYVMDQPISIDRGKSALLPIVGAEVEGKRVSIYNQSVQQKHPLYGLRLKNTSKVHLMQGPITVFADGLYGGDARIEDLRPDEERLISYGIDLAVSCEVISRAGTQEMLTAALKKGTLITKHRYEEKLEYNLKSSDDKPRTVLVEHPFRQEWKLLEPAKCDERTPAVYRFPVEVAGKKSAKLIVREEHQESERVELTDLDDDGIRIFVQSKAVSPAIKKALERMVAFKAVAAEITQKIEGLERKINEIGQEQTRIRGNISSVPSGSPLHQRYVKKLDEQESEIEKVRLELDDVRKAAEKKANEMAEFLMNLDVE